MLCRLSCDSFCVLFFFFFKQKTAYEMRISDWSSDVCSSDLQACGPLPDVAADDIENQIDSADIFEDALLEVDELLRAEVEHRQIGRASCRERVCQYV